MATEGTQAKLSQVNRVLQYREKCLRSFTAGRYADVLNNAEALLTINPADTEILRLQEKVKEITIAATDGDRFFQQGDYVAAIAKFKRILTLNPHDRQANDKQRQSQQMITWQKKLNIAFARANYSMVKKILQKVDALGINPADPFNRELKNKLVSLASYQLSGRKAFSQGRYSQANVDFRKALGINPKDDSLTRQLLISKRAEDKRTAGDLAYLKGDYHQAQYYYSTVVSLNASDQQTKALVFRCRKILRILAQADQGKSENNYARLVSLYQAVLKLNPDDPQSQKAMERFKQAINLQNAVLQALTADKFTTTEGLVSELLNLNPRDKQSPLDYQQIIRARRLKTLGDVAFQEGRYTDARKYYLQVETIKKNVSVSVKDQ